MPNKRDSGLFAAAILSVAQPFIVALRHLSHRLYELRHARHIHTNTQIHTYKYIYTYVGILAVSLFAQAVIAGVLICTANT